jgi:hypothetical protein
MWNLLTILVGLLGLANLVFTYGVTRRLREISKQLSEGASQDFAATPEVGTPVPPIAVTTVDGSLVTGDDLSVGDFYVGYFTPNCAPCQERLPEFGRFAREVGPDRVLIVVGASSHDEGLRFVGAHAGDARVVIEEYEGPLATAFGISRTPTMLMLENGVVRRNAAIIGQLRTPVPA